MLNARKYKIIIAVLVVLTIAILPAAFSVSYAKWTGGNDSVNANVTIGEWNNGSTETELEHSESNCIVAEKDVFYRYHAEYVDGSIRFTFTKLEGNEISMDSRGYLGIAISEPIRLQIYYNGKAITEYGTKGGKPTSSGYVQHDEGSLWYSFEKGVYNISYQDGTLIISRLDYEGEIK